MAPVVGFGVCSALPFVACPGYACSEFMFFGHRFLFLFELVDANVN
jgi:hypothetical protein